MEKLERDFYNRDAVDVAQDLLGKTLVHETAKGALAAMIVETEAYMGVTDKAAHSYNGRRTERVEVMYGSPGFAYVYFIYGMYYCLNVVTREEGNPQAVLIRGLTPIEGLDVMAQNRFGASWAELAGNQKKNLTNGPGKLCKALAIDKGLNGEDLCGNRLYILEGKTAFPMQQSISASPGSDSLEEPEKRENFTVIATKRIGIDYAEEAKDFLWRFYIEQRQS